MNRAAFFKALRARNSGVFGTSLSQQQVDGVEAILDECQAQGADLFQTAYILGTGYGETGGKMQPRRENMNYSAQRIPQVFGPHRRQGIPVSKLARNPQLLANTVYGGPWGRDNLGNTQPNDGWDFRGGGVGQWTGRYNWTKVSRETGIDLLSNPSLLDDLKTNAKLLVRWMLVGGATGRKLGEYVGGSRADYHGARKVWGGVEPAKYAAFAEAFEKALRAGGYSASAPREPEPHAPSTPPTKEAPNQPNPFAAIFAALASFFKGRNA